MSESKHLISLRDVPPQGRDFTVSDPEVWSAPAAEFGMDCRIADAQMTLNVLPLENGWLLRGRIGSTVTVPCSRCMADTVLDMDEEFEDFIDLPGAEDDEDDGTVIVDASFEDDVNHLVSERGALMLDLAGIAWEQFSLALDPRPLCKPDCKGLCPTCGTDLNTGTCSCTKEEGDPRLAVLRGLKLKKS